MEVPSSVIEENLFRERSATIEMTSQNIELLNRRNEKRTNATSTSTSTITTCITTSSTTTAMTIATDSCWPRSHEVQSSIEASPVSDKPTPPTSSPPRSPDQVEGDSSRGAVPRRSGSCSSSSSSSSSSSGRSSDPRISPRSLSNSFSKNENSFLNNRKVSSPTQTDNTGSSNISTSPVRSNQTKEIELRMDRSSLSSKSRSGGRSSTSSSVSSSVSKASSSSSSRNSPVEEDVSFSPMSPCVSPQPGIEGLTLLQRTEVVLRVNTATSDVASQTDIPETTEIESSSVKIREILLCRKKLPEEIECEELGRDLASQLNPNDKLVPLLGKFICI